MKKLSKFLALLMLLTAGLSVMVACDPTDTGEYTYNSYFGVALKTWNPHEYQQSNESSLMGYIYDTFVDMALVPDEDGNYSPDRWEWKPAMASKLPEDVTAQYAGTAFPYGIPASATEGWAFKITLRENLVWENGDPIKAQHYVDSFKLLLDPERVNFRAPAAADKNSDYAIANAPEYYAALKAGEAYDYEANVGYKALSEHELLIVHRGYHTQFYSHNNLQSYSFLVHEETYRAYETKVGSAIKTTYGTRPGNTMSYGAYRLASLQPDAEIVLERNPSWYGYELEQYEGLYQTTRIVFKIMNDPNTIMQEFLAGNLNGVGLTAAQFADYKDSSRLKKAATSNVFKLHFNADLAQLAAMEAASNGALSNLKILANRKFREAVSWAMNRSEITKEYSAGNTPEYAILNNQWVHDISNNPTLTYRSVRPAMEALAGLYSVPNYKTMSDDELRTAVSNITGYDVNKAKALFTEAATEAGVSGDVKIKIQGGSDSPIVLDMFNYIQTLLTAGCAGSGINVILTYETSAQGLSNMIAGTIPMWFGDYSYPYIYPDYQITGMMWDAAIGGGMVDRGINYLDMELELTVNGVTATKTAEEWETLLFEEYGDADQAIRATIMAGIERLVLEQFGIVPLYGGVSLQLQSYKYETAFETYDQLFGFGGFAYITYNYNDDEWAAFVAEQGGTINYMS